MRIARTILIIFCGALLGGAVGLLLRARHEAVERSSMMRRSSGDAAESSGQREVEAADGSSLTNELARNLSLSSGVTHWLHWMDAVERASLADFPRLARLAAGDRTAIRLITARWAQLDPKNFFNEVLKGDRPAETMGYLLIRDWAKKDANALIAAFNEAGSKAVKWRTTAADAIIQENPELGLQLIGQWNISMFGPSTSGVRKWAAQNPQHAAEFVLAAGRNFSSDEVMRVVGEEWGKSDAAGAVQFGLSQEGKLGNILASAALASWAQRDLGETTRWLEKSDATMRNRLAQPIVQEWAKTDPASALTWAESNLTGSSLNGAAAAILKSAAEKDIAAAARLVEVMQPSSARTEGAVQVAEQWFPRNFTPRERASDEALTWFQQLDAPSRKAILERTGFDWASRDPSGLAELLSASAPAGVAPSVYESTARELARKEPLSALEWSSQLPAEAGIRAGSNAFAEWARSQPTEAAEWFNHLSPNDARRAEFLKMAILYISSEHNVVDRVAALPIDDRAALRTAIDQIGFTGEKRERLLSVVNGE